MDLFSKFSLVRALMRIVSRLLFGNSRALEGLDTLEEDKPLSLNACDRLLTPKILADFPDFDVPAVKQAAREALSKRYAGKPGFQIHQVVLSRYVPTSIRKTVFLQASFCFTQAGHTLQRRAELEYTYLLTESTETVAVNCPNCGGTIGYGEAVCPYCDSRVVNSMTAWSFQSIKEL